MLNTLVLLALGAVPGTPEPQPGDTGEAGVFLTWGNDAFGLPPGPDDHRTNQLTAWARLRGFQLVLDDSMLTDRTSGTRSDELTTTIGYELSPGLIVGAGYRTRGGYGGAELQQISHRAIGDRAVEPLPYDPRAGAPRAYVSYLTGEMERGVGYQSLSSALIATDGDIALDQGARAVVTWRWLTVWAGTRYQWRDTPSGAGSVRAATDEFERGLWVETGLRLGHLTFSTLYSPREGSAVGSVTLFTGF